MFTAQPYPLYAAVFWTPQESNVPQLTVSRVVGWTSGAPDQPRPLVCALGANGRCRPPSAAFNGGSLPLWSDQSQNVFLGATISDAAGQAAAELLEVLTATYAGPLELFPLVDMCAQRFAYVTRPPGVVELPMAALADVWIWLRDKLLETATWRAIANVPEAQTLPTLPVDWLEVEDELKVGTTLDTSVGEVVLLSGIYPESRTCLAVQNPWATPRCVQLTLPEQS